MYWSYKVEIIPGHAKNTNETITVLWFRGANTIVWLLFHYNYLCIVWLLQLQLSRDPTVSFYKLPPILQQLLLADDLQPGRKKLLGKKESQYFTIQKLHQKEYYTS